MSSNAGRKGSNLEAIVGLLGLMHNIFLYMFHDAVTHNHYAMQVDRDGWTIGLLFWLYEVIFDVWPYHMSSSTRPRAFASE